MITRIIIVVSIIIHLIVTITCFSQGDFGKFIWQDYFGKAEVIVPISGFLIGYLLFYCMYIKYSSRNLVIGFEKVKDIVRGTVNTGGSIKDLYSAYEHFKKTPGVEIIDIKDIEKLDKLQHISVNYIYEDRFIGEMFFRYEEK